MKITMTDLELTNTKMACLVEAVKLKQHPMTAVKYEGASEVDLASKLSDFVLYHEVENEHP